MLVYSNQNITTPQTFAAGFDIDGNNDIGNLSVNGLIDSIDVVALESIRVSLSEDQRIEGLWEILHDLTVNGM